MANTVKKFKKRSEELEKLAKPRLSLGKRKKIRPINNRLIIIPNSFSINFMLI